MRKPWFMRGRSFSAERRPGGADRSAGRADPGFRRCQDHRPVRPGHRDRRFAFHGGFRIYFHQRGGHGKEAGRAALYTGIAYVVTVALLILPYLLMNSAFGALAIALGPRLPSSPYSTSIFRSPRTKNSGHASLRWPASAWAFHSSASSSVT